MTNISWSTETLTDKPGSACSVKSYSTPLIENGPRALEAVVDRPLGRSVGIGSARSDRLAGVAGNEGTESGAEIAIDPDSEFSAARCASTTRTNQPTTPRKAKLRSAPPIHCLRELTRFRFESGSTSNPLDVGTASVSALRIRRNSATD